MAGLRLLRTMTNPVLGVGAASVRITLMILGVFSGLAGGIHAQEAPASSSARPIADSAERIARELWSVDDSESTDEQGRPRFRASITVDEFVLPPPWYETDPAIGRFRRPGTLYHQEFLSVVTPEAFRGGTLNGAAVGAGVSVDPGTVFDGIKSVWLERRAGALSARRACVAVRDALEKAGGIYRTAHATPGAIKNGALQSLQLGDGSRVEADVFVILGVAGGHELAFRT